MMTISHLHKSSELEARISSKITRRESEVLGGFKMCTIICRIYFSIYFLLLKDEFLVLIGYSKTI